MYYDDYVTAIDVHVLRQSKVTTLDEDDCLRVMVWEGESQFNPTEELCVGSLTGFTGACYVGCTFFQH